MKKARADWVARRFSWKPEDLVFLDECGSNRAMARRYGRGPRGQRVHDDAPVNYGSNLTLLGALTQQGVLTAMTIAGATNGDVFLTFLRELLCPLLRPGQLVVLDNLSAHKVKGVREAIEATGATLLYLPPYSPDLNPIELAWSKLKNTLRSLAARTMEDLENAVQLALDSITSSDCQGWFRHDGYLPST